MRMIIAQDRSEIYYKVVGAGKTVVLIHGNFQQHRHFERQIDFFSKYYRVIAMDTRDQGKSNNRSKRLDYDLIIEDLAQILQQENISRCAMIGFSDGANIALSFACRYPSIVRKLVLCSGNLSFDGLVKHKQIQFKLGYLLMRYIIHWKRGYRLLSFLMKPVPIQEEDAQKLVDTEALVIVGGRDIIKQQQTNRIVQMLPNVRFHTLLHHGHTIRTVDAAFIVDFLGRGGESEITT